MFKQKWALLVLIQVLISFVSEAKPVNYYIEASVSSIASKAINSDLSSFELFTHGRSGELLINGQWLGKEDIASFLINRITTQTKHISIYGCEFGKGQKGLDAVNYLQEKLQVSISASNNITGKNGDWILEVGKPLQLSGMEDYPYNLQCATYSGSITLSNGAKGVRVPVELYADLNNNGVVDATDRIIDQTSTDANGNYTLTNEATIVDNFRKGFAAAGNSGELSWTAAAWTNTSATILPDKTFAANDFGFGSYHVRLQNNQSIARQVDLSMFSSANVTFLWDYLSNVALNEGLFVRYNIGAGFVNFANPIRTSTIEPNNITRFNVAIPAAALVSTTTISFLEDIVANTSPQHDVYFDEVKIFGPVKNVIIRPVVGGAVAAAMPATIDPAAAACTNNNFTVTAGTLADNDSDGILDFNDVDDDNDGLSDALECGRSLDFASYSKWNNGMASDTAQLPTLGVVKVNVSNAYTVEGAATALGYVGGGDFAGFTNTPAAVLGPEIDSFKVNSAFTNYFPSGVTGTSDKLRIWVRNGSIANIVHSVELDFTTTSLGHANNKVVLGTGHMYPSTGHEIESKIRFRAIKCDGSTEVNYGNWNILQPKEPFRATEQLMGAGLTPSHYEYPYPNTFASAAGFDVQPSHQPIPRDGSFDSNPFLVILPKDACYNKVFVERIQYHSGGIYNAAASSASGDAEFFSLYIAESSNCVDTDKDGEEDIYDLDSDNDGIVDALEACSTVSFSSLTNCRLPLNTAALDANGNPTGVTTSPCSVPLNTDSNGPADYLDQDSDNDGCPDAREAGFGDYNVNIDNSNVTYIAPDVAGTSGLTNVGCRAPANTSWRNAAVSSGCVELDADINETFVGVAVTGSLLTNDKVPTGSIYGSPATVPGFTNPNTSTPTINANGTYTFTSSVPGVYQFNVPVCPPGQTMNCPISLLTITVEGAYTDNPPIANTDLATTKIGTAVTLNTLVNDAPGINGAALNPSTVTVTDAPSNGSTTVNTTTGEITYTPNPGFTGMDTLKYNVCDNGSPVQCTEAYQIITIKPAVGNVTSASDDYATTALNTAVSGNVITNDVDIEGNTRTVTAVNTTIAGVGTFVIGTNGAYTFTPATDYSGPAHVPYKICDNGLPQACDSATLYILVPPAPIELDADINETFVGVAVTGSLLTNDKVPTGSIYGSPATVPGFTNPNTSTPTINANGTYTFTSSVPGVYQFNVPVCPPGQTMNCPISLLTITVEGAYTDNPPIANTDLATTKIGTAVTLNTLVNDAPGINGAALNPSTVTVTDAPSNGSTTVNTTTGEITYTPNPGFTGMDTLKYNVCDNGSPVQCTEAYQIITIKPAVGNVTSASDDYATTALNTAVSGNVITNDVDIEGNTRTVTAVNTTIAGVGTFVIGTNGAYTFTPATDYSGPAHVPYKICDNGLPQACDSATLYILVPPAPIELDADINETFVGVAVTGSLLTNDKVPTGSIYGSPATVPGFTNPNTSTPTINANGTYTFTSSVPGVYQFNVPVCPPGQTMNCPISLLTITVEGAYTDNPPIANTDLATTKIGTAVTLNTLVNDAPGINGAALNPSTVTVTDAPSNGSTTVNTTTGEITYTPNPGFTGMDTLKYNVCDNGSPVQCTEAYQIITIKPAVGNVTSASDDYATTALNTAVSGNVITNDVDIEGNTRTVTAVNTTIAGVGTFVIGTNGAYTFTPATDYSGPAHVPYKICDNGLPQACDSATLYILVPPAPIELDADINETFVGVAVTGSLLTNDKVPTGSIYGSPATVPGFTNPNTSTPTINANGTYTFTSSVPGVYQFNVPVCPPGQTMNCPISLLTITVEGAYTDNPPIANTDLATTKIGTAVTLNTLVNDAPGINGAALNPSTVTVTDAPSNGSTTVNTTTGEITYTPNPGFTGMDTLKYNVCDNGSPVQCTEAYQIITIKPAVGNVTSASDDYATTALNTAVSGNVITNDVDIEGNTRTVTAVNTTIAGVGTFVIGTNGAYTFTPATDYSGPAHVPYKICDNGLPQACDSATLYILVPPAPIETIDSDVNSTLVDKPVTGNIATNDKVPTGSTYGSPAIVPGFTNPNTSMPTINANGTYTFMSSVPGVYQFNVPVCPPGQTMNCPIERLTITVQGTVGDNPPIANTDLATTHVNTAVTLRSLSNDSKGINAPDLDPSSVTVKQDPLHGTAMVDLSTGNIIYTPNPGFTGVDTLKYNVCDNGSPVQCADAYQIITIKPAGGNITSASDDFGLSSTGNPVAGDLLNNDVDIENNSRTVTAIDTTIAGVGRVMISSSGAYTFTPVRGYSGPAHMPYKVCDNGAPQACDSATLYLLVLGSSTLPVTIHDIVAQPVSKSAVKVSWTVSNEELFSHYELERALQQSNAFSKIAHVQAAGKAAYSYIDSIKQTDRIYYRLKLIDLNGQYSYSKVVLLSGTNAVGSSLKLFPNPAHSQTTLDYYAVKSGLVTINVIDMSGKIVETKNYAAALGNNLIKLEGLSKLPRGVYQVQILQNAEQQNVKMNLQ